ncbi:MAG: uroporphyrinogen decarboxylase family protein [Planctomycetota bacterium]
MTSREVVQKALAGDNPERIAMSLPAPYPHDFCHGVPASDPQHPEGEWELVEEGRWERTDEWGNTWARVEGFSKGEVTRGVLEDWGELDEIEPPDYDLPERYDRARETFASSPEKFRLAHVPGFPFNIARKMRRLDNFLVDVLAEPEKVEQLLAVVEEQLHHAMWRLAEAGADGVMFAEDWGTQDRLLVSPEVWHKMFKPGFERLCRTAHENGMAVFIHSCGYIYEAMNGMIEAGIDVFQFDQPQLYGIDFLADEFGGRTTFWCPVDIQKTLQTRDAARIEADARKMVERLGPNGGFIAGHYGSNAALGLDPKWQDIACRAFVKYGAPAVWETLKDQLPDVN